MAVRSTIAGLLVLQMISFAACQKGEHETPDVEPPAIVLPELHFAMYDSAHWSRQGYWPYDVWDSSRVSLQRVDTIQFDTAAVPKYLLYRSDTLKGKGDYYRGYPKHTQGNYMEIMFRGDTMITYNVLDHSIRHGAFCKTWGLKVP